MTRHGRAGSRPTQCSRWQPSTQTSPWNIVSLPPLAVTHTAKLMSLVCCEVWTDQISNRSCVCRTERSWLHIARLHLKRNNIEPAELQDIYGYLLPRVLPLRPRETLEREFYKAETSLHLEQQIQEIQSAW